MSYTSTSDTITMNKCTVDGITSNGTMTSTYPNTAPPVQTCGSGSTANYYFSSCSSNISYSNFTMAVSSGTTGIGSMMIAMSGTCRVYSTGEVIDSFTIAVPQDSPVTLSTNGNTLTISSMNESMTMVSSSSVTYSGITFGGTMSISDTALKGMPFSGTLDITVSPSIAFPSSTSSSLCPDAGMITATGSSTNNSITININSTGATVTTIINGATSITTDSGCSFWA